MAEVSPVPDRDLAGIIADMTRDALNRIAADVPVLGVNVSAAPAAPTRGGRPQPCPQVVLLLGPPYAPPGAELTYWWTYARWSPTQDQVDQVVRAQMLELRKSVRTEAIAPPGLRPPGGRPPSTLFLPPGSPAGQG